MQFEFSMLAIYLFLLDVYLKQFESMMEEVKLFQKKHQDKRNYLLDLIKAIAVPTIIVHYILYPQVQNNPIPIQPSRSINVIEKRIPVKYN